MNRSLVTAVLMALSSCAFAQTRVDLGNQSRNVDFSQAAFVRPFPVGAVLPVTCQVGQFYFLTTAPAGANECVSTNTWAPIQGSTGTTAGTIDVERTSSTVLTIGSQCSLPSPCLFRVGSSVYSLLAPATVTLSSGTGLAMIYLDSSANLEVGVSTTTTPALTCSGCLLTAGITQYPLSAIPIAIWNATTGAWDGSGTSNLASLSVPAVLTAGSNIMITESGSSVTISSGASDGSGGSGSGSGSGGGTGTGTFNPMDPTQFFRDHLTLASGFNNSVDGWQYSGPCSPGPGSGATGYSQESIFTAQWAQVSGAGSTCVFSFPSTVGSVYGSGTFDYWSGSTPAQLWVQATYQSTDTNATHYVGLANNTGSLTDFIGCRQIGSGDWVAVIRSGGSDIATADTGVAHDNLTHRLVVDNSTGTANTVRCTVDGTNSATATGTVPAEPFGWTYLFGASANSDALAHFAPFQYTIFLQGLPRQ
jgi:hypothetical protein